MEITAQPLIDLKKNSSGADIQKEKQDKLKGACKDFEAIMLKQMLTTMRKSVPKGGLFEKSYAEETFNSMHDEELSKAMSKGKGMGLGELMYQKIYEHHKDKI